MTILDDLRHNTDKALRAMALLPGAVEMDAGSVETVAALSDALKQIDYFVDHLKNTLDELPAVEPQARELWPDQVQREAREVQRAVVDARRKLDTLWSIARNAYSGTPDSLDEGVYLVATELNVADLILREMLGDVFEKDGAS